MLTGRIAQGLLENGISVPEQKFRAPHILCLKFVGGMPAGLVEVAFRPTGAASMW